MLNNISKIPINQPSGKPHLASMKTSRENKTAKNEMGITNNFQKINFFLSSNLSFFKV